MFDSSQKAELTVMLAPILKRLAALESRPDAEQTAAFFAGMKGEDAPVDAEVPPDATLPAPAKHAKSKKKDAAAAA